MHEQMKRLYDAAKELRGAKTQAELARLLNESSQTVKNWEARGISAGGLLSAQEIIGCDAIWVRDGVGEMRRGGMGANTSLADAVELLALYAQSEGPGRAAIMHAARTAAAMSGRAAGPVGVIRNQA